MLSTLLLILVGLIAIGIITIVIVTGSVFFGVFGDLIILIFIVILLVKLFKRKK